MKHLLLIGVVAGGLGIWYVFFTGGSGDPLARRDALMAGPVIVEYETGPDYLPPPIDAPWKPGPERWMTHRDGTAYEPLRAGTIAVLAFGGAEADETEPDRARCVVALTPGDVPADSENIPGITYARTLLSGFAIEREGDTVRYQQDDGRGMIMRVAEDLSHVGDGRVELEVRPDITGGVTALFTIRAADDAMLARTCNGPAVRAGSAATRPAGLLDSAR